MDVLHCADMTWGKSLVAQRGDTSGMAHKRLFEGEEGSPDNYMLVMAREPKSYFSPRHRHPWDQIRFCLSGKIPIAKGLYIEGGEIAYFPESAYYGPQEGGEDRIVLLLQFGGASGQGFIGPDQLNRARLDMAQTGTFANGVYTRETDGGRHNKDAYEAVWHYVHGADPDYVSPVYKTPIVMRPEALAFAPTSEAGVGVKHAGIFPHRGLSVRVWRIDAGSTQAWPKSDALRFLFVTQGCGSLGGNALRHWSAVRLHPDETPQFLAQDTTEIVEWEVAAVGQ